MTGFEWIATSGLIAVAIVLIAILLVWRTLKDRKAGFPAEDERTQKITGRAARMALNAGSFFRSRNPDREYYRERIPWCT